MARRDLTSSEQIFYEQLISDINHYVFSDDRQKRMIETLDDLIDAIINNEENPDNFNDWEF